MEIAGQRSRARLLAAPAPGSGGTAAAAGTAGADAGAAWSVEGATEAFRHFRILQTASNFLNCAGIELYGAFHGPAA